MERHGDTAAATALVEGGRLTWGAPVVEGEGI